MKRYLSLDLARGFTVLFIPSIHCFMLYAGKSTYTTVVGYFLTAVAEGPGAQLLMTIMGIVLTFKEKHSFSSVLVKSSALLIAGYLLNVLKFVIPMFCKLLPEALLADVNVTPSYKGMLSLLLLGDILHFAAIALLVLYVITRLKNYAVWAVLLSIIIIFISPCFWDLDDAGEHNSLETVYGYSLSLMGGEPPRVFFPLFPWLVYPLTGLAVGYYLQKNISSTWRFCGIIGAITIMIGVGIDVNYPQYSPAGFYRTYPSTTLWHMGIVLCSLHLWYLVQGNIKKNIIVDILIYSSKHITSLYFIQWILICWLLPLVGYHRLQLISAIGVSILVTLATYSIVAAIETLNNYRLKHSDKLYGRENHL